MHETRGAVTYSSLSRSMAWALRRRVGNSVRRQFARVARHVRFAERSYQDAHVHAVVSKACNHSLVGGGVVRVADVNAGPVLLCVDRKDATRQWRIAVRRASYCGPS